MLKLYVTRREEVRERADEWNFHTIKGGNKSRSHREAAGTPNDGSVPRPDKRKEVD